MATETRAGRPGIPMMSLGEAASAMGGVLDGADRTFDGVCTDTRVLRRGDLFVALTGERFDGHDYLARAVEAGAVAALVQRDLPAPCPLLRVADTRAALGALAAWWRSRHPVRLAAVTGSNGKTTVKEMLAGILAQAAGGGAAVLATRGNLNNDIGLPLTLLDLHAGHRYAVAEMGMNHPGELGPLSRLARPDVALVNNAQRAHLEGLSTVEAVARAKGEIFEGLGAGGSAVINADDPHAPLWRELATGRRILDFGLDAGEVRGRAVAGSMGSELSIASPWGGTTARIGVPGLHNARNALAASAAALALGAPLDAIAPGLAAFTGVAGRLARKSGPRGATVIDDSYNANPDSLLAAVAVLASQPGRRMLVLGDMGELGPGAPAFHAEIGAAARSAGIDALWAVGELSRHAVEGFGQRARHFADRTALTAELARTLDADWTALVKGSRSMRMEEVVGPLTGGGGHAA